MSEESSSVESGTAGPDTGGLAQEMALEGASRAEADAFLKDQRELIGIQKHHLLKQFGVALWEKRLGVLLRISTAFVGIAFAAALGVMIWDASQSSALLIEPFAVPPDLAATGLTGDVIATKVLDRLTAMQAQTSSVRDAKTYAHNWGQDDIKLEIPETGVSLSELDRFLRAKLGHDVRVSGEVVRNAAGLSLTARAGGESGETVTGPETDLDKLIQSVAETTYKQTQPHRYGLWLATNGRAAEAVKFFTSRLQIGTPEERTWAHLGLASSMSFTGGDEAMRISVYHKAAALDPGNLMAQSNLRNYTLNAGRLEETLQKQGELQALLSSSDHGKIRSDVVDAYKLANQAGFDSLRGAYHESVLKRQQVIAMGGLPGGGNATFPLVGAQSGEHDVQAARASLKGPVTASFIRPSDQNTAASLESAIDIDLQAQDWKTLLSDAAALSKFLPQLSALRFRWATTVLPSIAIAHANLGQFAEAEREIAPTPGDCYPCLIARAQIAALQRQNARADWWFDRAVEAGPSLPFAYTDWGKALMQRGDLTGAIAKFKLANQKGPHFADPLEMWGEVLIAQNRSDLALAKFAEAAKYAPNWGRLHLKWGEALSYLGKTKDAQAQFALAATLDLLPREKTELAKVKL